MIESLQGAGTILPVTPSPSSLTDSQGKKEVPSEAIDYRVSLNSRIVETLTYDRTASVDAKPLVESPDFGDLLSRLLKRQGVTYEEAVGGKSVEIDPETQAEAQALISEEGYWGVKKTSERIFQFAVTGAGGDPAKLETIKAAIEKGFGMAAETLGGTLPDISSKTYDAVMEKLEAWADKESMATDASVKKVG